MKYVEIVFIDKEIIKDFWYVQKPVRGKIGFYNMSYYQTQTLHEIYACVSVMQRWSSNVYQPSIINNLVIDVCDILKNNETLIAGAEAVRLMWPEALEIHKKFIHPCPFLPDHITLEMTVDAIYLPDYTPIVDGKVMWRFYTSKNRTLGLVNAYGSVKRGLPPTLRSISKKRGRKT